MKKVVIIGAGPAGMTAGWELSKNNEFDCLILEKQLFVGGMARSFHLFDQIVDVGPHRFFSKDNRVNKLWLEVIGKEYKMVDRVTRIYYNKSFFDYPLKPFNALRNLGIFETVLCLSSYFKSQLLPHKNSDTFEGWVSNKFGNRLYNIFFKSYTEKLWGISCDNLSSEFAKQRIKNFSLGQAILTILGSQRNKHKTLVDQFAYPLKGNGYVYEKMREKYLENNGEIEFGCTIQNITYSNGKFQIQCPDRVVESDYLISTMPITDFLRVFQGIPSIILEAAKNLKFRNTILVYVKLKKENLFKDQWLYVQDKKIKTGRITNFNNWIPDIVQNQRGTVLALEYWCFEEEDIWKSEKEHLEEIAFADLTKCGFVSGREDMSDFEVVRIPKCYPLYDNNYKESLDQIIEYISSFQHLQLIGRYGSFKYNNQDHSILMGHLAALNISTNIGANLWDINTDYDYHESSTITSTGLVAD